MTHVDDFDAFYASTGQQTLLVTYALVGDRKVALDSTVDAYRNAARDWSKVAGLDPVTWVRSEAWHLTSLHRTTHPLHRTHEEDGDTALLGALHDLTVDQRRLLVLMTLGETDLDDAAREVQVTSEEGIELATEALSALESSLGEPIEGIERRLGALGSVTEHLAMPPVASVRAQATTSRIRNTAGLVVATLAAVLGLGLVVTQGSAFSSAGDIPERHKLGQAEEDQVLIAASFTADQLLDVEELSPLDPGAAWDVSGTEIDVAGDLAYATCPTGRFADPDPQRTFVRTFEGSQDDEPAQRVTQAVEISGSQDDAATANETMLRWFAECQHPRVQLISAYTVQSPNGDSTILRLRSYRDGVRTFTVGLSGHDRFTVALVHDVDGRETPEIEDFAAVLTQATHDLCAQAGDPDCSREFEVVNATPPPAENAADFLATVDLPPVEDVDSIWSATEVQDVTANPSSTGVCEEADLGDVEARSRTYLMPEDESLPERFGLTESVILFPDDEAAQDWLESVGDTLDACPDEKLSVTIDDKAELSRGDNTGWAWDLNWEMDDDSTARVRTGLVRRGAAVAHVTLTPVDGYNVSDEAFVSLVERAGQRLSYAETP